MVCHTWLLPSVTFCSVNADAQRHTSAARARTRDHEAWRVDFRWWNKAVARAGLEPKRGRGWHSLRRKFASDLMDQPLKVLCELGGWKAARTVLQCYQRANEDRLREALEDRRRSRSAPI